ncbi:MAG: hypothetical protein MK212_05920 [Saprospiraceae bacterium]|nr:hypothetical protein [Saprospiraceae bacterium]
MKVALLLIPLSFLATQIIAQLSDGELQKQLIYKSKKLTYKEHNPKDIYRLELINDYTGRAPDIKKGLIIPKGLANYTNLQELIVPHDIKEKVLLEFAKLPNIERVVIRERLDESTNGNWYYRNTYDWSPVFEALDKFPKLRILGLTYTSITYIPSNFNGPHLEEIYFRNGDYNWSYPSQLGYQKTSQVPRSRWTFKWYTSFETLKKLPKLKKVGISKEDYKELTDIIYAKELFKKDPLREIAKLKTWMLPWVAQKIMTEEDLDVIKDKKDEQYLELLFNEAYQEEVMAEQGILLKPSLHKELIGLLKAQGEENLSISQQAIINYFYAVYLEGIKRFDEAEKYYKEWAALRSKDNTDEHSTYMRWTHRKIAEFYSRIGKSQLARKGYEDFLTYLDKDDLFADFNGLMIMAKEYRDWKNADWLLESYYQYNVKYTDRSEWRYYWKKMSYDLYTAILNYYDNGKDSLIWEKWGVRWIELSERYTGRYSDLFEPPISVMQRMYNFDEQTEQVPYLEWAFLTAKIKDKLKRYSQGDASNEYHDLMVLLRMADMPDCALWAYQRYYELNLHDDKEIYYPFLNSCVATLVEKEETLLSRSKATLAEIARLEKKYPDDEEMQKWVIHNQAYIQARLDDLEKKTLPASPVSKKETTYQHPITNPLALEKIEQVSLAELPNWEEKSVHRLVWKGNELNQIPKVGLPENIGKLEHLYELELRFLDFDENVIKELEIFIDKNKFPYLHRVVIQGLGETWSKEERKRVFDCLERLPNLKILSISGLNIGSLPESFTGKNLEQLFLVSGDYQNSYKIDVNRPFPKGQELDWLASLSNLNKLPKLQRLNIGRASYLNLIQAVETLQFYEKVDEKIIDKLKTWAYYELETGEMKLEDFKQLGGEQVKDFDIILAVVKKQNDQLISSDLDISTNDLAPLTWDYAQKKWDKLTKDHQASTAYLYAEYLDKVKKEPKQALEYYLKWYNIRVEQGGDKALWAYRAMRDYYFQLGDEKSADAEHQNMLAVAAEKDLECLDGITCSDIYHYYQSVIRLCNRYGKQELATEYAAQMMNEPQLQYLDTHDFLWENVLESYHAVIGKYKYAKDRKNMEKWIRALYKLAAKDPLLRAQRVGNAMHAVAMERISMDDDFYGIDQYLEYQKLGLTFLDKKSPKTKRFTKSMYLRMHIVCRQNSKMLEALNYYRMWVDLRAKESEEDNEQWIVGSALNTCVEIIVSNVKYDGDEALLKEGKACLDLLKKWKKRFKNDQFYQEWAAHNIPFLENYVE